MQKVSSKIMPTCQIFTEPPGMTDLEKWQGTWIETAREWKGQNVVFDAQNPRWTTTVKGNRSFVTDENGAAIEALKFSLMPGAEPKSDRRPRNPRPEPGQWNVGIYQFEGDILKICWPEPGQDRPTEFSTRRGGGSACRPGNGRPEVSST